MLLTLTAQYGINRWNKAIFDALEKRDAATVWQMAMLWNIGGSLTLPIGGTTFTVPGFLVVATVIYAAIASLSMAIIGRRFVRVSENRNQAEAEYRYALTRVRENGESIALLGGEVEERAGLDRTLKTVLHRWRQICGQHMRTTIVSQGSSAPSCRRRPPS